MQLTDFSLRMAIFSLVFFKVLSALLSVVIGYGAGRYSNVKTDSIASLLFYFIAPIVFFAIPTNSPISFGDLSILLVTFFLCSFLGICTFIGYYYIYPDNHRNILSLSSGTGNGGYVVLPIATALFDDKTLAIYALCIIGMDIYASSVGYYLCTKSVATKKQALLRVAKLPILNAFAVGCLLSMIGFQLPDFFDDFVNNMKGAYSILGMLMIGLAISEIKELNIDWKFIGASFASKFLFFPLMFNIFILADRFIFNFFDPSYYNAFQLLSMAPLATSTIIIASLHKLYPEKMATAVLLSQIFVLIYMPIMAMIFLTDIEMLAIA